MEDDRVYAFAAGGVLALVCVAGIACVLFYFVDRGMGTDPAWLDAPPGTWRPELRSGLRDLGVLGAALYLPAFLLALALAAGISSSRDPDPVRRERRLRRAARACGRLGLLALLGGVLLAASLVWEYASAALRYGGSMCLCDTADAWTRFFAGVPAGGALAAIGLVSGGAFGQVADRTRKAAR